MQQKYLRSVPTRLKRRIAQRARRDNCSVNDAIVAILAAAYGLEYEGSGFPYVGPISSSPNIVIRMPSAIRSALEADAAERGMADSDRIKQILAAELGEPFRPTARWAVRRPKAAAA